MSILSVDLLCLYIGCDVRRVHGICLKGETASDSRYIGSISSLGRIPTYRDESISTITLISSSFGCSGDAAIRGDVDNEGEATETLSSKGRYCLLDNVWATAGGNDATVWILSGKFLRYLQANAFIRDGEEDDGSARGDLKDTVVWQMLVAEQ